MTRLLQQAIERANHLPPDQQDALARALTDHLRTHRPPPVNSDPESAAAWTAAIADQWAADLADPRQDIYTESDGEAVNASR